MAVASRAPLGIYNHASAFFRKVKAIAICRALRLCVRCRRGEALAAFASVEKGFKIARTPRLRVRALHDNFDAIELLRSISESSAMKAFAYILLACLPIGTSWAATAAPGWAEVIGKLTDEKRQAEVCVGLLKSRGDKATIDGVKLDYGLAKAKVDGVIAGLTVVLFEGGKPEGLPTIQDSLTASGAALKRICDTAAKTAAPNTKGVWDEVAKAAIEPLIKAIADGIGGLWAWKVDNDKLLQKTRQSKLEAAQWPEFADISPL